MDVLLQIIGIIFWFIIILLPLVAIHEFGHLLFARLVGVKVNEYGIGIPPRWKFFRWKGIIWSLNFVLLGGFARIYGDHDALDEAKEMSKTDKVKAREDYKINRFGELVANQEIQFFLEDNNLEYDEEWKWFEKEAKKGLKIENAPEVTLDIILGSLSIVSGSPATIAPTKLTYEEKKAKVSQRYDNLTDQLITLIDWEFESKLNSKEAFFNKNWFQQTLIIIGGVTFNLLSAIIFFWIMFGITGTISQFAFLGGNSNIEKYADVSYRSDFVKAPQIIKNSPADKIGLKPGDDLITFAGQNINQLKSIDEFKNIVKQNTNQEVSVTYRNKETGEIKTEQVKIEEKNGETLFGVQGLGYEVKYKAKNFISGFQLAVSQTYDYFILNFKVLGQIGTALLPQTADRSALEYVSGPIAVSSFSSKIFREYGASGILQLLALISIGLAAFNILPLPALDGGRLVILTLNKITGKRSKKWEAIAISITFFLLLALGVFVAFKDINGIATGKF